MLSITLKTMIEKMLMEETIKNGNSQSKGVCVPVSTTVRKEEGNQLCVNMTKSLKTRDKNKAEVITQSYISSQSWSSRPKTDGLYHQEKKCIMLFLSEFSHKHKDKFYTDNDAVERKKTGILLSFGCLWSPLSFFFFLQHSNWLLVWSWIQMMMMSLNQEEGEKTQSISSPTSLSDWVSFSHLLLPVTSNLIPSWFPD